MKTETLKAKTMTEEQRSNLERELMNEVNKWVDTFNFIQLNVLETMAEKQTGGHLIEFIEGLEVTWEDIAEFTGETVKQVKKGINNPSEHESYDNVKENKENNNYPMWNTCFEFGYLCI